MDQQDPSFTLQYVPLRGISARTMEFFGVQTRVKGETPVSHDYVYPNSAVKRRFLDQKQFVASGPMSEAGLWGIDRFPPGSSKSVTVTEGELDAMSVFQMLGSRFPVVSIRSASSAKKDCVRNRDYLNSFERIYLCLDTDGPGKSAKAEIASLFDFNKIYDVNLGSFKDANDMLQAGRDVDFRNLWYNSRRFLPDGVVSSFNEFDAALDESKKAETLGTFPFPTLQQMTYGIRPEVYLFKALEGIGKTEIFRAIEYHLIKTTKHNVGVIHLEESKARTLKGIAGYELGVPCHLPDSGVSVDEIKGALRKAVVDDERLHVFSTVGSDDPDQVLEIIRFLVAACGCRVVFLDHITMLVTSSEQSDERQRLDYLSTRLAMMVEELGFALMVISHVNDDGQTRGSRNISKVAHTTVHLKRDLINTEEELRNTTSVTIEKNRFSGKTGFCGNLYFDPKTFVLQQKETETPF